MEAVLIADVVSSVRDWVKRIANTCLSMEIEVLLDNPRSFRAIFTFHKSLAEVYVAEPDFAPYRYVSFAVATIGGEENVFYTWYDSEESIPEIIEQLDKGLLFARNNEDGR